MAVSRDQLIGLLEPTVTALGYELVELEYIPRGQNQVLRVYIDTRTGVTVDDCACVSEAIEEVLDSQDPILGRYSLEVSSPGIERPLRKSEDYSRFAGERVKIRTTLPINGQRNFTGSLIGLDEGTIVLETGHGQIKIPMEQAAKVHLTVK